MDGVELGKLAGLAQIQRNAFVNVEGASVAKVDPDRGRSHLSTVFDEASVCVDDNGIRIESGVTFDFEVPRIG